MKPPKTCHGFASGVSGAVRYVIHVVIPIAPRYVAATLAVVLLVALAACAGGSNDPTPTGTPTRTPVATTPVPSDVVVDFTRAEKLYYEGDYEQALTIYAAAAQKGTPDEKQRGLLAMARIQAERGDNTSAVQNLESFRKTNPTADDDRVALLMLGRARLARGDLAGAREALEAYVEADGPAVPYAMLYLAQIANGENKPDEAIEAITAALEAGLPAQTRTDSLMLLAELYASANDHATAAATYRRAVDAAFNSFDAADALWFAADEAQEANDPATATAALQELILSYPASGRALDSLSNPLVAQNPAVTARERGLVYFRNSYNDEAAEQFASISAAGGPGAAEAEYYLGILHERWELWDDAIAHYDLAISLAPDLRLKAEATWDRATVLERLGRTDEAIAGYAAVADIATTHEQADEGVFRAGMLSYQLGRPADALTYWQRFANIAQSSEETARANFWLARASMALGDDRAADNYFNAAYLADPLDYWGLRGLRMIQDVYSDTGPPDEPPATNWANAEIWLTAQYGPEDTIAAQRVFSGEAWLRANELLAAGLGDRADDEFGALLEEHASDPWLTYRLARAIDELGRPWVSSPAAFSLIAADAPPEIFRLVYPLEYWDIAKAEARRNGFSPLLLLALVRQESLYDPGATSIADALGLTQVIPSTGEGIAQQLGVQFRETDLLRPRISLRFGAHYLGEQLEGFGGQVAVALSAYNGGPGNASRWWEAAAGDPDLFVETIDYPETRSYVELVLENYARYLYAYGVTDELSLPSEP